MKPARMLACALFLAFSRTLCAEQAASFEFAGAPVLPGTRADVEIHVPAGESDPETTIPVTILHGPTHGPVLALTAGVHGFEFAPILAVERIADRLDPGQLRGTIILVRVANRPAFEHRSPYVNPHDRKNLNRSFPGSPRGTQTERIAWTLTEEVVRRADFVIDAHSGDGAEWLEAFVGVYAGALATNFDLAMRVAESFGFPNIVRYDMDRQEQVDCGRSLNRQAVADRRPTVLVEIGENGRRDDAHVDAIVRGFGHALAALGILHATDAPATVSTRAFRGTVAAVANASGMWTPVAAHGRDVKRGELLGVVRDYTGAVSEEIRAPEDGYALYGLAGPPVRAGDSVVTIARPAASVR